MPVRIYFFVFSVYNRIIAFSIHILTVIRSIDQALITAHFNSTSFLAHPVVRFLSLPHWVDQLPVTHHEW